MAPAGQLWIALSLCVFLTPAVPASARGRGHGGMSFGSAHGHSSGRGHIHSDGTFQHRGGSVFVGFRNSERFFSSGVAFGSDSVTTYDGLGPFPTALSWDRGRPPEASEQPVARDPEQGLLVLTGSGGRVQVQIECEPGRVSQVPQDSIVPRCVPAETERP